jgi:hypothetical protein
VATPALGEVSVNSAPCGLESGPAVVTMMSYNPLMPRELNGQPQDGCARKADHLIQRSSTGRIHGRSCGLGQINACA